MPPKSAKEKSKTSPGEPSTKVTGNGNGKTAQGLDGSPPLVEPYVAGDGDEVEVVEEGDGDDEEEEVDEKDDQPQAGPSNVNVDVNANVGNNKKKKKKSKAGKLKKKIANALRPGGGGSGEDILDSRPEPDKETVDLVKTQFSEIPQFKNMDQVQLAKAIEAMKLQEFLKGEVGVGGKNKKDMADYKFWSTQPVPKLGTISGEFEEGVIEEDKPSDQIRPEPYPLPKDFEWADMDLDDPAQLKEVYQLLTLNYVEDDDAMFRFDYSADFFEWALKPPGYVKDWHIGVRVSSTKKLVAFISGIPMNLRVRNASRRVSEVNFLCVHKKLRSKRLAPVLIKEVTRRCNRIGVFQAIYTAGAFLPTPISQCRYYHRTINARKLVELGFSAVPRRSTMLKMIKEYELPAVPALEGLRELEERDLDQVGELLRSYLGRFEMAPVMDDEEVRHNFWNGRGRGKGSGKDGEGRENRVTWTYVVEDPKTKRITDFFSFYSLPSTAVKAIPPSAVNAAYLFYYATTACPACEHLGREGGAGPTGEKAVKWSEETFEQRQKLKVRLNLLIRDLLIVAQKFGFDVVNSLTLMDNTLFINEQKFGPGDGWLHYYLYNWKVHQIAGGCSPKSAIATSDGEGGRVIDGEVARTLGRTDGSGIGVVML